MNGRTKERKGGPLGTGARPRPDNNLAAGTGPAISASVESELFHHRSSIKEVRNPADENTETSCSVQLLMLTSRLDAGVPGATGNYKQSL